MSANATTSTWNIGRSATVLGVVRYSWLLRVRGVLWSLGGHFCKVFMLRFGGIQTNFRFGGFGLALRRRAMASSARFCLRISFDTPPLLSEWLQPILQLPSPSSSQSSSPPRLQDALQRQSLHQSPANHFCSAVTRKIFCGMLQGPFLHGVAPDRLNVRKRSVSSVWRMCVVCGGKLSK